MKLLLSCKEATGLVSQGLDRRLSLFERLNLRVHLLVCEGCSRVARQLPFLRRALQSLDRHEH